MAALGWDAVRKVLEPAGKLAAVGIRPTRRPSIDAQRNGQIYAGLLTNGLIHLRTQLNWRAQSEEIKKAEKKAVAGLPAIHDIVVTMEANSAGGGG
jgi:hypothetical protein